MFPGRRAFPVLSVCICFLGLFSSAGCSRGPDRLCLIQQIPELEGDGCRLCLTQRVDCWQEREQPAEHPWKSASKRKRLQEVRESQPVCTQRGQHLQTWHLLKWLSLKKLVQIQQPMDALGLLFNMQNIEHSAPHLHYRHEVLEFNNLFHSQ